MVFGASVRRALQLKLPVFQYRYRQTASLQLMPTPTSFPLTFDKLKLHIAIRTSILKHYYVRPFMSMPGRLEIEIYCVSERNTTSVVFLALFVW